MIRALGMQKVVGRTFTHKGELVIATGCEWMGLCRLNCLIHVMLTVIRILNCFLLLSYLYNNYFRVEVLPYPHYCLNLRALLCYTQSKIKEKLVVVMYLNHIHILWVSITVSIFKNFINSHNIEIPLYSFHTLLNFVPKYIYKIETKQ
jgi:hypothetical protein